MLDYYLEQEYPTIKDGSQDGTIFMPDYFISKEPEMVDESWFLDKETRRIFKRKETNFAGDQTERILFERLRDFLTTVPEQKTVMLHSFRNEFKGQWPEFDFLIINGDHKFVVCIECKANGSACRARDVTKQLHDRFVVLNQNLALKPDWSFIKTFFALKYSDDLVSLFFELL